MRPGRTDGPALEHLSGRSVGTWEKNNQEHLPHTKDKNEHIQSKEIEEETPNTGGENIREEVYQKKNVGGWWFGDLLD